ncbi:MAG: excinuclease ABC subunit UvrC, partial [Chlamydiales bacterium]|nr:excinuclease ABC subunit UvrC [Chlamydiales bacterium]
KVIYVGKAKNLKTRIKQYFVKGRDLRAMVPFLIEQTEQIDTLVVSSEKEALLLENTLIKKHQPKFNALLKDDKTFISLMLDKSHPFPLLRLIRYKNPLEKALYFGPYTSAEAARSAYNWVIRLFPLRQCSDEELKRRKRPCILYSIKRCCAPCVGKCTQKEYDGHVAGAIDFLEGKNKKILKSLYEQMQTASDNLEYEKASSLLKTIRHLEDTIHSRQSVTQVSSCNADAIGLYRQADEVCLVRLLFRDATLIGSEHFFFSKVLEEDEELITSYLLQSNPFTHTPAQEILVPVPLPDSVEEILSERFKTQVDLLVPKERQKRSLLDLAKKNAEALFFQEKEKRATQEDLLLQLQEICKLTRYPQKIECFDISHHGQKLPVAAKITFIDGKKERGKRRLFQIETASAGDDLRSIQEALRRSLIRSKEEDLLPDLIIIDGGKTHLNAALAIFKELDIASIDLIAVAKESGKHTKGMTQEQIFLPEHHDPILLHFRSPLLFLLQRIRDEAHRQAIRFFHLRSKKKQLSTQLDTIPGIGKVKRMRLLQHFGSFDQILKASEEELLKVKGITSKEIQNIKNHPSKTP